MNFLEAIEANKTRRVWRTDLGHEAYKFHVGELRQRQSMSADAYEAKWEAEPEKIEWQGVWLFDGERMRPTFTRDVIEKIERLVLGKTTKITIEVLND